MSGSLFAAALKLVVCAVLIASALHYRANRKENTFFWLRLLAPTAVGFLVVLVLPVPIFFWAGVAWLIGTPIVWYANKREWIDLVPWNDYGPLTFLDGARLRLWWQTAARVRRDYRSGVIRQMVAQMHSELDKQQKAELEREVPSIHTEQGEAK